jgi:hypothetical protein
MAALGAEAELRRLRFRSTAGSTADADSMLAAALVQCVGWTNTCFGIH